MMCSSSTCAVQLAHSLSANFSLSNPLGIAGQGALPSVVMFGSALLNSLQKKLRGERGKKKVIGTAEWG